MLPIGCKMQMNKAIMTHKLRCHDFCTVVSAKKLGRKQSVRPILYCNTQYQQLFSQTVMLWGQTIGSTWQLFCAKHCDVIEPTIVLVCEMLHHSTCKYKWPWYRRPLWVNYQRPIEMWFCKKSSDVALCLVQPFGALLVRNNNAYKLWDLPQRNVL